MFYKNMSIITLKIISFITIFASRCKCTCENQDAVEFSTLSQVRISINLSPRAAT